MPDTRASPDSQQRASETLAESEDTLPPSANLWKSADAVEPTRKHDLNDNVESLLRIARGNGDVAALVGALNSHLQNCEDPKQLLCALVANWKRVVVECSDDKITELSKFISSHSPSAWFEHAKLLLRIDPCRLAQAIRECPVESDDLTLLGSNFVKRSNCPDVVRDAFIEAVTRKVERFPGVLSLQYGNSKLLRVVGSELRSRIVSDILASGNCSELAVSCMSDPSPKRWVAGITPTLSRLLSQHPTLLIDAIEAGADPRRIPGASSAAAVIREYVTFPLPIGLALTFRGNESFVKLCFADEPLRLLALERLAKSPSPYLVFSLLESVNVLERKDKTWRASGLSQVVRRELIKVLDKQQPSALFVLDDPAVRFVWGDAEQHPVPIGASGYRHTSPFCALGFLDSPALMASDSSCEQLKERLVIALAGHSTARETDYLTLVSSFSQQANETDIRLPDGLLTRALLDQQLSPELAHYARAHPLIQMLTPPLLFDAGRLAKYGSWGRLPEQLRQGIVSAVLFDSSLLSPQAREELLTADPSVVRNSMTLLRTAVECGFRPSASITSIRDLDVATRGYIAHWLIQASFIDAEGLVRELTLLPAETLVAGVSHLNTLAYSTPELRRSAVLGLAGKLSSAISDDTEKRQSTLYNQIERIAFASEGWRSPMTKATQTNISISSDLRELLVRDALRDFSDVQKRPSLKFALQRYREAMSPLQSLDRETKRLREQATQEAAQRYSDLLQQKRRFFTEHKDSIIETKAQLLLASVLAGYVSSDTGKVRVLNHAWPWVVAKETILASSLGSEQDVCTLIATLDDLFNRPGKTAVRLCITDGLSFAERLKLSGPPFHTCLHITSASQSENLHALASSELLRPIVVTGPNGTSLARALMIFCSRADGSPAILVEQVYPQDTSPELLAIIRGFAVEKGAATGAEVFFSASFAESPHPTHGETQDKPVPETSLTVSADSRVRRFFLDSINDQSRGVRTVRVLSSQGL